jgi:D-glycerate 3-kinase
VLRCGGQVARLFRLDELQLSEAGKARFLWCEDQVVEHRTKYNEGDEIPPLVVSTQRHFLSIRDHHK